MAQSAKETQRRMTFLVARATVDRMPPNAFAMRAIALAILNGNMFARPKDKFFVMGYDGFDHQFFPAGSSKTVEGARRIARTKIAEEPRFSHGDETISSTFHIFTREGVPVPLETPKKPTKK